MNIQHFSIAHSSHKVLYIHSLFLTVFPTINSYPTMSFRRRFSHGTVFGRALVHEPIEFFILLTTFLFNTVSLGERTISE